MLEVAPARLRHGVAWEGAEVGLTRRSGATVAEAVGQNQMAAVTEVVGEARHYLALEVLVGSKMAAAAGVAAVRRWKEAEQPPVGAEAEVVRLLVLNLEAVVEAERLLLQEEEEARM